MTSRMATLVGFTVFPAFAGFAEPTLSLVIAALLIAGGGLLAVTGVLVRRKA